MWIVTGPFDSETSNEVAFQKSKLLKSGKEYLIGRKPTCDLFVNHKKVSHDHGKFIVAGFSPDDITNTDYAPTLQMLNSKNKTMRIWREGAPDGVIVNPGASVQLRHDDRVDIVSGLPLTVQWQRICCFETPGKVRAPISIDGCASIGVHVVRTLHPDITHHLVPSYALTPAHMTSLLSAAQLVKPEWLTELIDLSILNPHESPRALEHTFALPSESKFRPGFSSDMASALKTIKAWEPNETRLNMLKGYRFVFVGDKGLEVPAGYRDLVKRGGAEHEAFAVSAGVVRWRKALVRAKALAEEKSGKAVPVADGDAMELAVGAEEWEEIVSVAKSLELEFIQPENILQAVASVDAYFVDSSRPAASQVQESPLPDMVPNTLSGEPSIAPPIHTQHPPRAISPSPEPEVPMPRRLPPRRANRTAPSPGPANNAPIGDASTTHVAPLAPVSGDAASGSTQLPTPVSQTRKLPPRRRANLGTDTSSALVSASSHAQAPQSQFSQLDKYKALFDASNPDRVQPSETQSGTGTSTQGVRTGTLGVVPEEQESQIQGETPRGTKRGRATGDGDDDENTADGAPGAAGTSTGTSEVAHRGKRRALDANAISQPASGAPPPTPAPAAQSRSRPTTQTQTQGTGRITTTATGTTTKHALKSSSTSTSNHNKLDTDENFLRAVNSTKRGKKLEDDFDREFNLLRIAKPKKNVDGVGTATATATDNTAAVRASEVAVAPWDGIDDFGDVGIRGNFMIVVEMNIERGGSARPSQSARTDCTTHPEWAGRPNFKKFKAKGTAAIERRETIELVPSEDNDYGIGKAYWRSGASGSQSYSDVHDITAAHPPPLHSKSKPVSKASRTSTDARGRRGKAPVREDDDHEGEDIVEDVDMDTDEVDSDAPPPLKSPSTRSKAGAKAKAKAPAAATTPASKTKSTATPTKGKTTTSAKTKGSSPARTVRTKTAPATRATTRGRGKKAPALFLSDSEEEDGADVLDGVVGGSDADEIGSESAAAVAAVLGVGVGVGGDEEDEVGDGTVTRGTGTFAHGEHAASSAVGDGERADGAMTSTLRSTAGTQLRRSAVRAAKRRAAAMGGGDDDDSDDAVFKGFGGRKRGRVR